MAGGSLDLSHPNYDTDFNSIRRGLEHYVRELETTIGRVGITYFQNLVWDGATLNAVEKPCGSRDFGSYEKYREFLDESMAALVANARDARRAYHFELMSTLSTGYDSPAVSVLANNAGCTEVIGFDQSADGQPDDAREISQQLDVRFHSITTSDAPNADVAFLAAVAGNGGSVIFKAAEPLLAGRVVFTGFHGDKVWDKQTTALGPDMVRGDTSGSDLTEYRLATGFVHCPVPFWGVRQIRDIHAISNSPELAPWDVDGSYSRPICRRIVEERGVPRHAFGQHKRGVMKPRPNPSSFLTPQLQREYYRWLRAQRWQWIRRGKRFPSPALEAVVRFTARYGSAVHRLRAKHWVRRLGPHADRVLRTLEVRFDPTRRRRLHRYVFHWAVDEAKSAYPLPPSGPRVQPCR
ncbi:MAG: hypothetical protein ACRDY6_00635 [Acidimicrobiia bacterium]